MMSTRYPLRHYAKLPLSVPPGRGLRGQRWPVSWRRRDAPLLADPTAPPPWIGHQWCLCGVPGVGWWLVPGKPATLPPPTTAHSRRESLRSPAAPLPPGEKRANSSPPVQREVLATRANFPAKICTGNFSPKTSRMRFQPLPVQLPVQILRHLTAFSCIFGAFRARQNRLGFVFVSDAPNECWEGLRG